jgi:hypothetical protein
MRSIFQLVFIFLLIILGGCLAFAQDEGVQRNIMIAVPGRSDQVSKASISDSSGPYTRLKVDDITLSRHSNVDIWTAIQSSGGALVFPTTPGHTGALVLGDIDGTAVNDYTKIRYDVEDGASGAVLGDGLASIDMAGTPIFGRLVIRVDENRSSGILFDHPGSSNLNGADIVARSSFPSGDQVLYNIVVANVGSGEFPSVGSGGLSFLSAANPYETPNLNVTAGVANYSNYLTATNDFRTSESIVLGIGDSSFTLSQSPEFHQHPAIMIRPPDDDSERMGIAFDYRGRSSNTVQAVSIADAGDPGVNLFGIQAIVDNGEGTTSSGILLFASSGGTTTPTFSLTSRYLYVNPSGGVEVGGDIKTTIPGKGIVIKGGSNSKVGQGTLDTGTVTIATTAVTANSRFILTPRESLAGTLYVGTVTPGTSFVVNSTESADGILFDWVILEES